MTQARGGLFRQPIRTGAGPANGRVLAIFLNFHNTVMTEAYGCEVPQKKHPIIRANGTGVPYDYFLVCGRRYGGKLQAVEVGGERIK